MGSGEEIRSAALFLRKGGNMRSDPANLLTFLTIAREGSV